MALQASFASDLGGNTDEGLSLEWLLEENLIRGQVAERVLARSQALFQGMQDKKPELDGLIQAYAPAWPVRLLSPIDRNILRIALYELHYRTDTPAKAAVNEAVELAKVFGSESSARFVNGVLGTAMSTLNRGELNSEDSLPNGDDLLATVYNRVRDIVVDKLGVEAADVNENASFVDDLNADSLDLVELIMAFEEEFTTADNQVEISDEDAGNILTVGDAVNYLMEHGVTNE